MGALEEYSRKPYLEDLGESWNALENQASLQ